MEVIKTQWGRDGYSFIRILLVTLWRPFYLPRIHRFNVETWYVGDVFLRAVVHAAQTSVLRVKPCKTQNYTTLFRKHKINFMILLWFSCQTLTKRFYGFQLMIKPKSILVSNDWYFQKELHSISSRFQGTTVSMTTVSIDVS